MRTIKVRYIIRSKETKKIFIQIYTLDRIQKGNVVNEEVYEIVSRDLFIGLKDKNRKEICEGDILKVWRKQNYKEIFIGKIIYHKTICGFLIQRKKNVDTLKIAEITLYNLKCEVIGNKFENPELLGE